MCGQIKIEPAYPLSFGQDMPSILWRVSQRPLAHKLQAFAFHYCTVVDKKNIVERVGGVLLNACAGGEKGGAKKMPGSLGPNLLITGTPGTGKTCTSQQIAERTGLRHINVGDVVRLKQCHEGRDESFDTFILDEDKVCDAMEAQMEEGGNVVDFHSCDFFPERWFDLILVLRADTSTLFDRLQARGYSEKKVGENVECEIMQVVLEEAKEAYPEEAVHEVPSNSVEELESNVARIVQWLDAWRSNNPDK